MWLLAVVPAKGKLLRFLHGAWCPRELGFPPAPGVALACHSPILTLDPLCHNRIHPSSTPISVVKSFPAHEWPEFPKCICQEATFGGGGLTRSMRRQI